MKQREARLAEAQDDMRRVIDVTANTVPVEQVKELPAQAAPPQLSLSIPTPTFASEPQTAAVYKEPAASPTAQAVPPPLADEHPAEEAGADSLYAGMDF